MQSRRRHADRPAGIGGFRGRVEQPRAGVTTSTTRCSLLVQALAVQAVVSSTCGHDRPAVLLVLLEQHPGLGVLRVSHITHHSHQEPPWKLPASRAPCRLSRFASLRLLASSASD